MKNRFVAGILVVLFLEVCFHVFNEAERVNDQYVAASPITSVSPPPEYSPVAVAELPVGNEYFDDSISPRRPILRRAPESVRPQFVAVSPRFEQPTQPMFEPIRITYPSRTAVALSLTPAAQLISSAPTVSVSEVMKSDAPVKKEPSLAAKVVKTPYQFLKFVGSKLK